MSAERQKRPDEPERQDRRLVRKPRVLPTRPIAERRQMNAAGELVAVEGVRRRSDDLHALLVYACEYAGVVALVDDESPNEEPRGYEVGFALSLREAGRAIALEPEIYRASTKRRHFSAEQLQYIKGLIQDLPTALADALVSLRKGLEPTDKS